MILPNISLGLRPWHEALEHVQPLLQWLELSRGQWRIQKPLLESTIAKRCFCFLLQSPHLPKYTLYRVHIQGYLAIVLSDRHQV